MAVGILIVDDRLSSNEQLAGILATEHQAETESDPNAALFRAAEGNFDLLIVSLGFELFDGLRLCSQLRSLDRTRNVPILAIAGLDEGARLVRGLEIGINDYLSRPIDKNELLARVRTQVRKKRYTERLRDNVQMSIEMAITDALTGLYNRRYMEGHVGTLIEQATTRGKPLTVLVMDIDYFKSINDNYGHDAGDDVLREFAIRIRKSIRGIDLACRYGGEEFVVLMPETDLAVATMVAERLRRRIASEAFPIQQGARNIDVTLSIGIAALACGDTAAAQRQQLDGDAQVRRARRASPAAARPAWRRRCQRGRELHAGRQALHALLHRGSQGQPAGHQLHAQGRFRAAAGKQLPRAGALKRVRPARRTPRARPRRDDGRAPRMPRFALLPGSAATCRPASSAFAAPARTTSRTWTWTSAPAR